MQQVEIEIDQIQVEAEPACSEPNLKRLVESMGLIGQLAPIMVRQQPDSPGYQLVCGRHQLLAARRLPRGGCEAVTTAGSRTRGQLLVSESSMPTPYYYIG